MLDTLILRFPNIERESRDKEVVDFCQNFPNLESVDIKLGITKIKQEPSTVEQLWMDLLKVHKRLKFIKYNSINRPESKLLIPLLISIVLLLQKFHICLAFHGLYKPRMWEFIRKNLQKAFIDITV